MMYGYSFVPKNVKVPNTLQLKPPGFQSSIQVQFPDSLLPVCLKCKKNYKTKLYCRAKECHQDLPWSDTFICITLDASCVTEDGKLVPGPFSVTPIPMQLFCFQTDATRKSPICARCKQKSYTRTYCRNVKFHTQLPWSTVFVQLTVHPSGLVDANVGMSDNLDGKSKRTRRNDVDISDARSRKDQRNINQDNTEGSHDVFNTTAAVVDAAVDVINESSCHVDLQNISERRTMLATVSVNRITLEWVDSDPNYVVSMVPSLGMQEYLMSEEAAGWPVSYLSSQFHTPYAFPMLTGSSGAASSVFARSMIPNTSNRRMTPTFPIHTSERLFQQPTSAIINDGCSEHRVDVADHNNAMGRPVPSYAVDNQYFPSQSEAMYVPPSWAHAIPYPYENNIFHAPWNTHGNSMNSNDQDSRGYDNYEGRNINDVHASQRAMGDGPPDSLSNYGWQLNDRESLREKTDHGYFYQHHPK